MNQSVSGFIRSDCSKCVAPFHMLDEIGNQISRVWRLARYDGQHGGTRAQYAAQAQAQRLARETGVHYHVAGSEVGVIAKIFELLDAHERFIADGKQQQTLTPGGARHPMSAGDHDELTRAAAHFEKCRRNQHADVDFSFKEPRMPSRSTASRYVCTIGCRTRAGLCGRRLRGLKREAARARGCLFNTYAVANDQTLTNCL